MSALALSLLGSPQFRFDGKPVTGLVYQKSRALLYYLAQESDRVHTRDEVVGLLWPDLPEVTARSNLRQVLTDLRKVIAHKDLDPRVLSLDSDSLQFNADDVSQLDTTQFLHLL